MKKNSKTRRGERNQKGEETVEERRRKDEENAFFIPMTRLPVACWIFRRAAEPPFRRIEKERKTKRRRKERRKSGERVRRECSLELEQSQLLHSSSFFLLFSFPPLSLSSFSPLLSSMNPRGVSSRNITHKPPRLLLFSTLVHPSLSNPLA